MTVFLWIVSILLFLLCMRVSVWVCWEENVQITIGYLFFKIGLNKPKNAEKRTKKVKKDAENQPDKDEKQADNKPQALTDTVGIVLDLVRSATGGMRMIFRNLLLSDLTLHMTVADEDAAQTAVNFGKISAYLYGAYAALQNYIRMKRITLDIQPDFLSDKGSFTLCFRVQLTPLVVLGAALRIGASFLWKMIKRGLAAQEGNQKEPQQSSTQPKEQPAGKA